MQPRTLAARRPPRSKGQSRGSYVNCQVQFGLISPYIARKIPYKGVRLLLMRSCLGGGRLRVGGLCNVTLRDLV